MKKLLRAFLVLTLLAAGSMPAHPQNSFELTTLGENIVNSIQSKEPDWKYESVSPITGSADIILQQWTLEYLSVRIAIVSHRSVDEAAKAMRDLARVGQATERLQDLGDEGISWGRGIVSFRKRNLRIDVSAVDTHPTLDVTEVAKYVGDERKLCKKFARLVADAIKDK